MIYDEERLEEQIAGLPQHLRNLWQPDGMSAPPERALRAPRLKRDPNDCEHPRHFIIEVIGGPRMLVCLECGTELPS